MLDNRGGRQYRIRVSVYAVAAAREGKQHDEKARCDQEDVTSHVGLPSIGISLTRDRYGVPKGMVTSFMAGGSNAALISSLRSWVAAFHGSFDDLRESFRWIFWLYLSAK